MGQARRKAEALKAHLAAEARAAAAIDLSIFQTPSVREAVRIRMIQKGLISRRGGER